MEPIVDFGLFEIMAASGIVALGRYVYRRRAIARLLIVVSLVGPFVLVFTGEGEFNRWIAALCIATSALNATVLWPLTRRGHAAKDLGPAVGQ